MERNLQLAKEWVREQDAELLSFGAVPFIDSETILRGWPAGKIPKDRLSLCKDYLVKFGSAKNNKASDTITDPMAGKEVYPGTWWHSNEGWQVVGREFYLTQVVHKGHYQDISFQNSEIDASKTVETRQQLGLTSETAEPVSQEAGKRKFQSILLNRENGSRDVKTDKETGTAQTTTTKVASPARSTTITEKTVQTAQLSDPVAAKGFIRRIINRASRYFSRFDTFEEEEQPTDQVSNSFDVSPSGVTSKEIHSENPDVLTQPVALKGTIYRQESIKTEAGNDRTSEE